MSILQVANVQFETTGANRIEYTGNNVVRVRANGGFQLPFGTTAQRAPGETGLMRYNTDTGAVEAYGGAGTWDAMPTGPVFNVAYGTVNSSYTTANAAFAAANAEFTFSNTIYAAVNSAFAVTNAAFAKANTALQNTSGTFSGALTVTGGVSVPNEGAGGYYTSLNSSGTNKIILSLSNNGMATDATRLRSAGGGVSIENSSTSTLMSVLENGNVGIGTLSPSSRLQIVAPAGQLAAFGNTSSNVNSWIGVSTGSQSVTWGIDVDNIAYTYTPGAYKIFTGGANERMRINSSGNVGIGTDNPVVKFQTKLSTNNNVGIFSSTLPCAIGAHNDIFNAWGDLQVGLSLFSMGSGNVGIGSTSPQQKLDVVGLINSTDGSGSSRSYIGWKSNSPYGSETGLHLINVDNSSLLLGTNNIVRAKIDVNGRVTMPYQPAFWAYGTGTQSWSGTSVYTKLDFSGGGQFITSNKSSGWNQTNSRFTCPVAGTYEFIVSITTSTASSSGPAIVIYKNGGATYEFSITYSVGPYTRLYGQFMFDYAAGDYVEVFVVNYNNTTFTIERGRCSFSGKLVS